MHLSETEAADKYCIQSMHMEDPMMCDGSKCMAWRWKPKEGEEDEEAIGYCGLVPLTRDIGMR